MAGGRARGKAGRGLPLLSKRLADDTLSSAAVQPRRLQALTGSHGPGHFCCAEPRSVAKPCQCLRSASFPASTSKTGASSRGSTLSTSRTQATPWRRQPPTMPPVPTNSASSILPPVTNAGIPSSTSWSARLLAASCRSRSVAAFVPVRTFASSCALGPTRCLSTRRRSTAASWWPRPPTSSGRSASWSPSTPRGCRTPRRRPVGRYSHTGAGTRPALMPLPMPRRSWGWVPVKFCSPQWIATAPKPGLTSSLHGPWPMPLPCRSLPRAVSARSITSSRGLNSDMQVPCWPPRSSITERSQSHKPSAIWRPPALPCALTPPRKPHSLVLTQASPQRFGCCVGLEWLGLHHAPRRLWKYRCRESKVHCGPGLGPQFRLSCLYARARALDLLEKDDCLNGEQSPSFHRPPWRSRQRCGAIRQRRVSKVLGAYPRLTLLV